MAEAAGMMCTPHMSGSGLGYVNVLHFASFVPNITAHQEFKGESNIPYAQQIPKTLSDKEDHLRPFFLQKRIGTARGAQAHLNRRQRLVLRGAR